MTAGRAARRAVVNCMVGRCLGFAFGLLGFWSCRGVESRETEREGSATAIYLLCCVGGFFCLPSFSFFLSRERELEALVHILFRSMLLPPLFSLDFSHFVSIFISFAFSILG